MRVGWLADVYEPPGGAELTQAEFRAAAPAGVQVVDVPPTALERLRDCDVACIHNSIGYPPQTVAALAGRPALRYWHDLARPGGSGDPALVRWALEHATNVFTSPLHRERFPHALEREAHCIPPALDLTRLRAGRGAGRRQRGACWLGSGQHAGKGLIQAFEWAEANEPVDFWGPMAVPIAETPRVRAKGPVPPEHVASILRLYRRFVFLPTSPEPFGRATVEAWAAGCELVVNRNVGALHWLERPDALERAARDFWQMLGGLA